jgi:O-antigen/teichoic acid export membrane protein
VHLVILGPAFLAIWVGPTFTEQAFQILLFLALAATAGAISTQVLIPFYQALDVVRVLMLIVVAEALTNIVLSIWLAQAIGLWGVALATAIPALAITLLLGPKYMLPRVGVSTGEFLRVVVVPALALAAVCVITQLLVARWLGESSYLVLAARVACSAAAAAPVVALTFPRDEWLPTVARLSPALATRFR